MSHTIHFHFDTLYLLTVFLSLPQKITRVEMVVSHFWGTFALSIVTMHFPAFGSCNSEESGDWSLDWTLVDIVYVVKHT